MLTIRIQKTLPSLVSHDYTDVQVAVTFKEGQEWAAGLADGLTDVRKATLKISVL